MSYCDDCILLDICGKEGCCDEAMTFCADKNKFIHVSILDKIKDEMDDIAFDLADIDCTRKSRMIVDMDDTFEIIDKYKAKSEEEDV